MQIWDILDSHDDQLEKEQQVWIKEEIESDNNIDSTEIAEPSPKQIKAERMGLCWPNGQLMSNKDQSYFRTAYSRGSMIQIGGTVYPNLGFNALQENPEHFSMFKYRA